VDPLAYENELERGFTYLDSRIAQRPVSDRFVLNYRWMEYLTAMERWEEAYELAHRSLALADSDERNALVWHGSWTLFMLCRICHALGLMDEMSAHAEYMAELSQKGDNLMRTLAAAWIWRAVARRASGNEQDAVQSFHRGVRYLKNVETRDEICA